MMRRYLVLFIVMVGVGSVVAWAGRRPHAAAGPVRGSVEVRRAELALAIEAGGVRPERSSVVSGTQVRITLVNHTGRAVRIALAGYEDRLRIGPLPPGGRWSGAFLADRPGDDFAWLVDGAPTGRLGVSGSHLVEGHR